MSEIHIVEGAGAPTQAFDTKEKALSYIATAEGPKITSWFRVPGGYQREDGKLIKI